MDVARILELLDIHDAGGLLLVDARHNVLTLDGSERAMVRELLRLAHIGALAEAARDQHRVPEAYAIVNLFRRHAQGWPQVTP